MSISQELVNLDKVFHELKRKPTIINDLADISEKERQHIIDLISITYDSDLMKSVASCGCDNIIGQHRIGEVCDICNQECRPPIEQDLEPIVWMRAPKGVKALMNPTIWTMLTQRFEKNGHDIIRWICDSEYKSARKPIKEIEELTRLGFNRSYNWFVDNFDQVMTILFDLPGLRKKPSDKDFSKNRDLLELIKLNRDKIFSKHLPLPNKTLLIIEKTHVGTYVDTMIVGAIDAINTIASIDHELCYIKQITRENRTVRALAGMADFYEGFYKDTLGEKYGIARRHMFGTRVNFAFRAVATSITEPHKHDEVHVSWGAAVGAWRYHVCNKLDKIDYMPNEAIGFLNKYSRKHSPLLASIFKTLISETRYGGVPITHGRNPSLNRGSLQRLRITKVKDDVDDPTVSFSILIVAPLNARFWLIKAKALNDNSLNCQETPTETLTGQTTGTTCSRVINLLNLIY